MKVRRTRLRLVYTGTDISQDVSDYLVSFSYTDNESGKADDLNITVRDTDGIWTGEWFPTKGDELRATIIDEYELGQARLACGRFEIDELESSGPPALLSIKAVSVPLNKTIRRKKKSKTWENVKLSGICTEVAKTGGIDAFYDVDFDPQFDRLSQREESDLAFLRRICDDEGISLKVTDAQIVAFDQKKYEARPSVFTITRGQTDIKSWRFTTQADDLYKTCRVTYYDPETEQPIQHVFSDPNVKSGMEMKIVRRAGSFAEAKRWAVAQLRKRNKKETAGTITVPGNTGLVAGVTVILSGFGKYDGKYIVEKATHSVQGGYTTTLEIRRVLEGY